jgi:hypothetical protein
VGGFGACSSQWSCGGSLEALLAVVTVLPLDAASGVPLLVVPVAGIAGAGGETVRMESGILVQRDSEAAVLGAEDVAAVSAMVSSIEKVEGGAALG